MFSQISRLLGFTPRKEVNTVTWLDDAFDVIAGMSLFVLQHRILQSL